jgi:3-oxoacyl-[acyl-carrier-protein] synthase III
MKQIIRNVKIIGTGSYVPEKIYTNKYLETIVNTDAIWIEKNLGIKERRIVAEHQATSDLAWRAASRAIDNANLTKSDIDLIIVATSTPDRPAPATACFVQDKLQSYNAVAFDIAAVCSGFLYGMSIASQYIASGVYDNVLVIGADTFSKITDWTKRECVFFGDGAGAAILSHANDNEGFLAFRLYSDGRGKYNFTVPAGGSENPASIRTLKERLHYFQMNGKEVYNTSIKVLPEAIKKVLNDAKMKVSDIDFLIPHQPSIAILKRTAEIVGLPFEKVMTNMDRYANTSGGTIPILLDELNRKNKLKNGNIILFAAIGAGWTWGASITKWSI